MDDRQFDEQTAKEWIETIEGDGAGVREKDLYPHLREWINQIGPKKILDLGCGQGACSEKLNLGDCSYIGIDPSIYLLQRAARLFPRKQFIFGNAYSIPFSDFSFDAVFSIAVWHLLEDKKKAAAELSRVLKNGGSFLIATANPETYQSWTSTYVSSVRGGARFEGKMRNKDGTESTDVLFLHSFDEIVWSLREAGLKVKETSTFRTVISIRGLKENVSSAE
jgi:ubiquinone/menaquinone biosynthesis C-methylase UbiE